MMLNRLRLLFLLLALLPLTLAGCGSDEGSSAPVVPDAQVSTVTIDDGPVSISMEVSNRSIAAGEPLEVSLEVSTYAGVTVTMPEVDRDEAIGDFNLVDAQTPPDIPDGDRRLWRHTYTLDTFESGDCTLGSLTIRWMDERPSHADPDGGAPTGTVETGAIPVVVASSLTSADSESTPRDIAGARDVHIERPFPWVWAIVVAVVIALGVATVLVIRHWQQHRFDEPVQPSVPAHIRALDALEALRRRALPEDGAFYAFHSELSQIVRTYIEGHLGLHAPEQTTEEFLRDPMTRERLRPDDAKMLGRYLRAADLVKFARQESSVEECDGAWNSARRFVVETSAADAAESSERSESGVMA